MRGVKVPDEVRALIGSSPGTFHSIAKQFGVSYALVYNIKHAYKQNKYNVAPRYKPTRHRTDDEIDEESADWLKQRGWL